MNSFNSYSRNPATVRARALMGAALSAVTIGLVMSGQAAAQQSAEVQEVTVTGSRIKAPNLTSESPVTAVGSEEIKERGTTNVEQLLNTLPEIHAAMGNTTSNGANGTATIDIGGLGPTRTLVLIDGRRIGPGNPSGVLGTAADVNFIPQVLISSVDVLKGGASAIYGSDAVAGVVNFHLLRNFEGVMLDEVYSMNQHDNHSSFAATERAQPLIVPIAVPTGSEFDGFVRDSSGVIGVNSPDHKGNVTAYVEYRATTPVLQGTRDWGVCPAGTTLKVLNCSGFSSTDAFGRYQAANGKQYALNPDGSATFVPFNLATQGYNFSPVNYLQRQDDRTALGALGHYEIKPWLDVYTEVMFMDDSSLAQIAPAGIFFAGGPASGAQLTLPCNYQYLSAAQAAQLCVDKSGNPLPRTSTITLNPSPGLRFASFPRQSIFDHEDYRAVAGARGDIDGNWFYDVSASYWNTRVSQTTLNYVSYNSLQAALNCTNGCVQPNIFQYNALTQPMVDAIGTAALVSSYAREEVVNANISGDLGPYGIKSPLASNPVAIAAGLEYRNDSLNVRPDQEQKTGDLLGAGGAVPSVNGTEDSREYYAEMRIPVIENLPLVKSANIDLAIRHSDYKVYDAHENFSTNTWKISADYAPTDDIRFRGGYNRAARAPNVYELLFPPTVGLFSGNDLCAGPTPVATAAACANSGVTAAQYGHINQCVSSQCDSQTGGNTALKPEEADTWTYGFNVTPTFVPGLAVSVDYWDVRVNQYISPLAATGVIAGCLQQNITSLCSLFHRDVNGSIQSQTGYVVTASTNFGDVHNRGVDFDASYRRSLDDFGLDILHGYGALTAKMNGTYNIENSYSTLQSYDCAGLYGTVCGGAITSAPNFTWRHVVNLTWDMPWDAQLTLAWRYLSPVKLDVNNSQKALANGSYDFPDAKIPSYSYFDLSAAWKLWDKYTIRAGVNNLFDKDPPVLSQTTVANTDGGANGNTLSGTYDVLGRTIFTSFNAKF